MALGAARPRAPLLPLAPDRYDRSWAQRLVDIIGQNSTVTVKTTEASPFLLLLSPGGKVFRIAVSDAGAISATEVQQGSSTL
jgi:hypothetical protein